MTSLKHSRVSTAFRGVLSLGLWFVWGCSGVSTSIHKHPSPTADGVSYFLPTNQIRIVFTNGTIPSDIKAATAALEGAKKAAATARDDLDLAIKARALADPKNAEEIKRLDEAVVTAKKTLAAAETKVAETEKALKEAKNQKEQILVEVQPPIADPSQVYVATLEHGATYHDKVTFKTSADGLLTQVSLTAEDQTRQIVQNLVETAIEAAKLYGRLHGLPLGPSPAKKEQEKARVAPSKCLLEMDNGKIYYFEFSIDPSDPDAVARVNLQLINTPLPFLMNVRGPKVRYDIPSPSSKDVKGVYYRRPVPYTIDILESADKKRELCETLVPLDGKVPEEIAVIRAFIGKNHPEIPTTQSKQVVMAAGGPVSWLKLDARPFVTTELVANFKDGLLLDTTETRPSELVGATLIPLETVKAVGNAVGEVLDNIIPVKIEWTNQQRDLVKAEKELLQAEKDKADLEKTIRDGLPAARELPAPPSP